MSSTERYRRKDKRDKVIAFSISWQRENFLARGLGLEHLKELLLRLARPLLRSGASLAYAGHWKETEDNFTYDLLRLISAEQEDNSLGGPDTALEIGWLYNHCAWPTYLEVTPKIEAQWINCCRIVRITQAMAGIPGPDVVLDSQSADGSIRSRFNAAVTLSAMRRMMMERVEVPVSGRLTSEVIPAVNARVLLGGKVDGYSGFLPGIFEEALVTLRCQKPLYILGGFGGAAEILAQAVLNGTDGPAELTIEWQRGKTEKLARLLDESPGFAFPSGTQRSEAAFHELSALLESARQAPAATFNTGLSDAETRTLMSTSDLQSAIRLVRRGLVNKGLLTELAA